MRHLLSPLDLSVEEIDGLIDVAKKIEKNPKAFRHVADGERLATLFYEPSTRTRLSFESAMLNLGGTVVGCYSTIIAMRHHKEGAPMVASQFSPVPIINAGDGGHQHPTQTLTDLLTIAREKGRLDHLTIGLCGDLKFGRTVHSLITALVRYPGVKFVCVSPEELRLPDFVREDVLEKNHVPYKEVDNLEEVMPELDILYMTRVQRERFFNEEDYLRLRDRYILDGNKMKLAPKDMIVLHPLPRVNEISLEVDNDPRAMYFKQAQYGVYIRMALIMFLLGLEVPEV